MDRGRISVRAMDRVRFRDRDRRSEPDCRSEAINFGANSDSRSEPNIVLTYIYAREEIPMLSAAVMWDHNSCHMTTGKHL